MALGHTCIGAIVGCGLAGRQIVRLGGFESALHAAGLTLLESNTRDTADTIAGGRAAAESLLEANPGITAIFATNDLMAYGAAQLLLERGIPVPQSISLVSITDIQLARDMRGWCSGFAIRSSSRLIASVAMASVCSATVVRLARNTRGTIVLSVYAVMSLRHSSRLAG